MNSVRYSHRVILFLVCTVFLLSGCSSKIPVRPVLLELSYQPIKDTFTSKTGWKVTLENAKLSFEYIRMYEKDETVTTSSLLLQKLSSFALGGNAWAHPGHSGLGDVLAEFRYGKSINLLNKVDTSLGMMQGFTGAYEAGGISFRETDTIVLEGAASKGSTTHFFQIKLSLSEQESKGIHGAREVTTSEPVAVQIFADRWFDFIDFDTFQKQDSTKTMVPNEASRNILRKAVVATNHYIILWKTAR